MSAEQLKRDAAAKARDEATDEADRLGREDAYRAAREVGGTTGMLDVFDAAVIRAIIKWIAPDPMLRRNFWADVKAEIEK